MAKRLIEMKRYRGRLWHRVTSGITSTLTYCNGCGKRLRPTAYQCHERSAKSGEPAIARWAAERATSSDLAQINRR